MQTFYLDLSVTVVLQAMLSVGLGVLLGWAGIFSAAQAIFYGVGAYIAALVALHVTASLPVAAAAGTVGAALVGLLMGIPAVRVKGDYFVVASLAFSIIMTTVFSQWTRVTNGDTGLIGIPYATLGSMQIKTATGYLITGLVLFAIGLTAVYLLLNRTALGRLVMAVRDDEIAAVSLGKNPITLRLAVVLIASAFSGLAGVVYAYYVDFVDPSGFGTTGSILIVTMVILGGTGRVWAPVLGAIVLGFGMPSLQLLHLSSRVSGPFQQIVEGLGLVLVMMFFPDGIQGVVGDVWKRLRPRGTDSPDVEAEAIQ